MLIKGGEKNAGMRHKRQCLAEHLLLAADHNCPESSRPVAVAVAADADQIRCFPKTTAAAAGEALDASAWCGYTGTCRLQPWRTPVEQTEQLLHLATAKAPTVALSCSHCQCWRWDCFPEYHQPSRQSKRLSHSRRLSKLSAIAKGLNVVRARLSCLVCCCSRDQHRKA